MLQSLNMLGVAVVLGSSQILFLIYSIWALKEANYKTKLDDLKEHFDGTAKNIGKEKAKTLLIVGMFLISLVYATFGTIAGKGFFLVGGPFGIVMSIIGHGIVVLGLIDFLVTRKAIVENQYFTRTRAPFTDWFKILYLLYILVFFYVC